MKTWQITAIAGALLLAGLGSVMITNNPDQEAYETFATQTLVDYAEQNLCKKVPFIGSAQCKSLLVSNQSEVRRLITQGTRRRDYVLFSIYETDLSPGSILPPIVASLLPSYHFKTAGVCQRFFVYEKKEQRK
ncbi:MAG: DUF4359 domain-containing protein [Kovacikia sp.]